jgi:acyl carrier protein
MSLNKKPAAVSTDIGYYIERLTAYVRANHSESFDPETGQLFDYLDSVGFINLIMFVENELGIQLSPGDLSLESCATVNSMADLLVQSRG